MKRIASDFQKVLQTQRAARAKALLSPDSLRRAVNRFTETGELPANRLQAAWMRAWAAFIDFTQTRVPLPDDPPGRAEEVEAKYVEMLKKYHEVAAEYGLKR